MYGELKNAKELFRNEKDEYENISYEYFLPNLLNNGFQIKNNKIYTLLEKAAMSLAELNADSRNIENIDAFLRMIVSQEAIKSSAIEGTRTTFSEMVLPEEITNDISKIRDKEEVKNYIIATFEMKSLLTKLPVSERFISNLHKILLNSVRGSDKNPGQIRKNQNWIGGNTIRSAKFIPPHWNELSLLMKDLCDFWHNDNIQLPKLVKMALFHYQFETIHPFEDGNGRIGRLLILAQLLDSGLLMEPCFNVSYIFERNRDSYLDALQRANLMGDIDFWIIFFLDSLLSAAQNTYKTYHEINELQKECSKKIMTLGAKIPNAQILLKALFDDPFLTIKDIKEKLNVTWPTAKNLAEDFIKLEIVESYYTKIRDNKLARMQQGIYFSKYTNLFE